jgi:hypothetical protein
VSVDLDSISIAELNSGKKCMAYIIGQIVGGVFGVFLLYALLESAIFKRVFDDPIKGKMGSVVAAYLMGSTLAGVGGADGGPFYWGAFSDYAAPAIIVGAYAFWQGKRLREALTKGEAQEVFE